MVQVLGWAADVAGCGYWRIALPFRELREQYGLDAPAVAGFAGRRPEPGALVIGQRIFTDADTDTWLGAQRDGHKIVFELDDDVWSIHPSNASPYQWWTPARQARLGRNIAQADLVTASTEALAEVMRRFNDNVVVLPNYVDGELLAYERPRAPRLTIGWAGSPSHDIDFEIVADPLAEVLARHPEVDIHFVGRDYSDQLGREARVTGWAKDVATYQRGIDFDIGLAPIAKTKFNMSKSHIKPLEYGALGIPTIASAFGPYLSYVRHGETGFLARTHADWVECLELLISDAALRERMGAAAKAQAAENTIQGHAHEWVIAYGDLLGE